MFFQLSPPRSLYRDELLEVSDVLDRLFSGSDTRCMRSTAGTHLAQNHTLVGFDRRLLVGVCVRRGTIGNGWRGRRQPLAFLARILFHHRSLFGQIRQPLFGWKDVHPYQTSNQETHRNATKRNHTPESPKRPIANRSSGWFGPEADPAGGVEPGTTRGPSHSNKTPGMRQARSPIRSLMLSRLRRSTALCDSRRRRRFSERWVSGSRCLTVDGDEGDAAGLETVLTCEAGREEG